MMYEQFEKIDEVILLFIALTWFWLEINFQKFDFMFPKLDECKLNENQ